MYHALPTLSDKMLDRTLGTRLDNYLAIETDHTETPDMLTLLFSLYYNL